jgi:hypothetical protein
MRCQRLDHGIADLYHDAALASRSANARSVATLQSLPPRWAFSFGRTGAEDKCVSRPHEVKALCHPRSRI